MALRDLKFPWQREDTANSPHPSSDAGPVPGIPDISEIKTKIRSGRKSRLAERAEEEREDALLESLYADENWEEIAALYFNIRYGVTGWEGFKLTEKQSRVLTASTSMVMRTLIRLDPRWLALILFSANYSAIIAEKESQYKIMLKAKDNGQGRDGS